MNHRWRFIFISSVFVNILMAREIKCIDSYDPLWSQTLTWLRSTGEMCKEKKNLKLTNFSSFCKFSFKKRKLRLILQLYCSFLFMITKMAFLASSNCIAWFQMRIPAQWIMVKFIKVNMRWIKCAVMPYFVKFYHLAYIALAHN